MLGCTFAIVRVDSSSWLSKWLSNSTLVQFESLTNSSALHTVNLEEETNMPAVELCLHCSKKIDIDNDEYVVISEATKSKGVPRVIAHVECAQKANQ